MPQSKIIERRAHPRVGPFDGVWNGSSGGKNVRITDVSEGGCFVETMAILALGDRVVIKLALPQGRKICVDGQVVTVDPGIGFAVRFPELRTDQRTEIRQAVQHVLVGDSSLTVTISGCTQNGEKP